MKTFPEDTLVDSHVLHLCMSARVRRARGQEGSPPRGAKPPGAGSRCCSRHRAAPPDPTEGEKITPLSCSHLTVWKGIASQCTGIFFFYFWGPTTWKIAAFICPLKGNPDTVEQKQSLHNYLFWENKSHYFIYFFPSNIFFLLEYI